MDRLKWLLVAAALAVAVSVVAAGPAAAAKGSNSANAKLCQKGGWQSLRPPNGSGFEGFASEEACVSYAAHGGTLEMKTKSQIDCESFRGTFSTSTPLWTCTNVPTDANGTLVPDCSADLRSSGRFGFAAEFDETVLCFAGSAVNAIARGGQ